MIEVIDPDIIIINEGLFPQGPENRGHVDSTEFRKKWLYKDTPAGFDWEALQDFVLVYYRGDSSLIVCGILQHDSTSADQCFIDAISTFPENEYWSTIPEVGDVIFPLEPDAFLYEGDKDIINEEISKLKPGEGLSCKWIDFLETQYYTEAINLVQPKYRRFCYCFDNLENYKEAINGFMSQSYPKLKKVDSFFIRHYCWFQPDPWKQLRYELIYRFDPNYWRSFDNGLNEIRQCSVDHIDPELLYQAPDKIVIRPSRSDEGRYAKFIDVPHPKAIYNHPNFVK